MFTFVKSYFFTLCFDSQHVLVKYIYFNRKYRVGGSQSKFAGPLKGYSQ